MALRFCPVRNCGERSEKTTPRITRKASDAADAEAQRELAEAALRRVRPGRRCCQPTRASSRALRVAAIITRFLRRRRRIELGDERAFGDDQDPVADGQHFRQV